MCVGYPKQIGCFGLFNALRPPSFSLFLFYSHLRALEREVEHEGEGEGEGDEGLKHVGCRVRGFGMVH